MLFNTSLRLRKDKVKGAPTGALLKIPKCQFDSLCMFKIEECFITGNQPQANTRGPKRI